MMSAPAPIGLLFLARTAKGLRYLEFMDRKSIKRMIAGHAADCPDAKWEASLLELKPITEQLEAYFLGGLREFELPLDPVGSDFQLTVWGALRKIPFGQTRTYGDVAKTVGRPKAPRAIGLANHDNPIAIIIPCHRVPHRDRSGRRGEPPHDRDALAPRARPRLGVERQQQLVVVAGTEAERFERDAEPRGGALERRVGRPQRRIDLGADAARGAQA